MPLLVHRRISTACILMQFRDNEVGDVHTYAHWGIYHAIIRKLFLLLFQEQLNEFKSHMIEN